MPKLRLTDADRKRLGVDEDLPFEPYTVTNREALVLAKLGYPTPRLWRASLFDKDAEPDALVWTGAVWIGLHRLGIETDIATLEFDWDGLDLIRDDPPPEVPVAGKAPGPDPSTNSAKPNSTSTATSKRRSRPTSSRS